MIRTTQKQKREIYNAIAKGDFLNNEKVWTYLIADILTNSKNAMDYYRLFCEPQLNLPDKRLDIWFEALPIPPRKGRRGNSERNAHLDLAFGNIKRRNSTKAGIEYALNNNTSGVCFVEAKCLSDCSADISHDPLRNQIIRVIENLLCFQNRSQFPKNLYFTLLTPRLFKSHWNSKLYGYKITGYQENKNAIIEDINLSAIPKREQNGWHYPTKIKDRIKALQINWLCYEQILEIEYGLGNIDIVEMIQSKNPPKVLQKEFERIKCELNDAYQLSHEV